MRTLSTPPEIIFVTGKGGVGKSSVALAQALHLAERGHRTLFVELGEKSYISDFLQLPELGFQPRTLRPNLDAVCWSGEDCLREYVLHYLKLERLYRFFFENRVMRSLLDVAPGLKEISVLGKITSGVRHHGPEIQYERVVVDTYATGHALALFQAPRGLSEAIPVGPMGEQCRSIHQVLINPKICSYQIVTLLEELPVAESEELYQTLFKLLDVKPQVIVNKALASPLSLSELKGIKEPGALKDFVTYLHDALIRQNEFRKRLTHTIGIKKEVPLFFEKEPWALIEGVKKGLYS